MIKYLPFDKKTPEALRLQALIFLPRY